MLDWLSDLFELVVNVAIQLTILAVAILVVPLAYKAVMAWLQ